MSSVNKSMIDDLQKKDLMQKKCFSHSETDHQRELVGEIFMKNGLLYWKQYQTKMESFNQLVIYSTVGIPEEVLTDQGTIKKYQEVSRVNQTEVRVIFDI